jgi:phage gp36-like protein
MYCTKDELVKRYRSSFVDSADEDKITQALLDAEAIVNTYIQNVVNLPLTTIPVIIVRITADIAMYYLKTSNAHTGDDDETSSLWKKSISILKDISSGIINPFKSSDPEKETVPLWIVKKNPPEFI